MKFESMICKLYLTLCLYLLFALKRYRALAFKNDGRKKVFHLQGKIYHQNLIFIKEPQTFAPPPLCQSHTRRPAPRAVSPGSGPRLNRRRWRQLATAAAFLNSSDKPTGGKLRKPSAVVKKAKAWPAARLLSSAFCNALPFYLTACIMPLTLPLPASHL